MAIISLANQKGGVGKTATAVHLSHYLSSKLMKEVLLVDSDSQQSSSFWVEKFKDTELDLPYQVISNGDDLFVNLVELQKRCDFIVVDAPGALAYITQKVIDRSDLVLIPIQPGELELHSVVPVVRQIYATRELRGKLYPKAAFFFSKADARGSTLLNETRDWLFTNFSDIPVMATTIHERVAIRDAPGQGCTVWQIASDAGKKARLEYEALFTEALTLLAQE